MADRNRKTRTGKIGSGKGESIPVRPKEGPYDLKAERGMTLREALFVHFYMGPAHFNAVKAMTMMNLDANVTARYAGSFLVKPRVKEAISRMMAARIARMNVTEDRVIEEIGKLAFMEPDIRAFYDEKGALKPISEWTEEMASWVSEINTEDIFFGEGEGRRLAGFAKKLKLHPKSLKTDNLKLLANVLRLTMQRAEINVNHRNVEEPDLETLSQEEATKLYLEHTKAPPQGEPTGNNGPMH